MVKNKINFFYFFFMFFFVVSFSTFTVAPRIIVSTSFGECIFSGQSSCCYYVVNIRFLRMSRSSSFLVLDGIYFQTPLAISCLASNYVAIPIHSFCSFVPIMSEWVPFIVYFQSSLTFIFGALPVIHFYSFNFVLIYTFYSGSYNPITSTPIYNKLYYSFLHLNL